MKYKPCIYIYNVNLNKWLINAIFALLQFVITTKVIYLAYIIVDNITLTCMRNIYNLIIDPILLCKT